MGDISDVCRDPVGQMDYQLEAVEKEKDRIQTAKPELILNDDMFGGYAELKGEMYCRDKCEYVDRCKEGIRIKAQYDLSKSPSPR